MFFSPTATKGTPRPPPTTSLPVGERVEVVTGAVEVRLVDMVEAINNHPNMEEVTTTSLRATVPPLHRATVSRASTDKVEVRKFRIFKVQP